MAQPTREELRQAFDAFDTDKSGQISTSELKSVLDQCGVDVTADQCAQLIKMFDANNSGKMEFDEFERLVQEALKHSH